MKCRKCAGKTYVVDSRPTGNGGTKRRRRECTTCHDRATTIEKYVEVELRVINGSLDECEFEEPRLQKDIAMCMKTSPLNFLVDEAVDSITRVIKETHEFTVSTRFIRETALQVLSGFSKIRYLTMFCDLEDARYRDMLTRALTEDRN